MLRRPSVSIVRRGRTGTKDAVAGQGDGEPGPPPRGVIDWAVYSDLTIMLLDYRVHQGQSQPGALAGRLGGEERFEQTILECLINAAALIFHYPQYLMFVLNGPDGDLVTIVAGIPGVAQQIDHHLGQALAVASHAVGRVAQVNILHVRAPAAERQQVDGLVGACLEVDRVFGVVVAAADMGEVDQRLHDA